jgi:hypothetical protein
MLRVLYFSVPYSISKGLALIDWHSWIDRTTAIESGPIRDGHRGSLVIFLLHQQLLTQMFLKVERALVEKWSALPRGEVQSTLITSTLMVHLTCPLGWVRATQVAGKPLFLGMPHL